MFHTVKNAPTSYESIRFTGMLNSDIIRNNRYLDDTDDDMSNSNNNSSSNNNNNDNNSILLYLHV
jgi:hypothetical protein